MSLSIQGAANFIEAHEVSDQWQVLALAGLIREREQRDNQGWPFAAVATALAVAMRAALHGSRWGPGNSPLRRLLGAGRPEHPAASADALTGDPACIIGEKKRHNAGDLVRLSDAAQRRLRDLARDERINVSLLLDRIGIDRAEQNAVHRNLPRPELVGQHSNQMIDGGVARPVASRNQLAAPEDECPQQDLAELRVGLHNGEPLFAIELDDLT